MEIGDGPQLYGARRCGFALLGAAVLTRLPAFAFPRAIDDEAVYGVVARVMLAGGLPYRDAIERKPPLLFALYWAIFRLFGAYDWLALHFVATLWLLLTMAGLYVCAARISGPRAGGLAALAYALVTPWATAKNLAFNGEMIMNLPLVCAYALVLRHSDGRRAGAGAILIAGLLLGSAFLFKQPAAIAALPLGLYLVCAPLWSAEQRWRDAIARAALLTAGFAAAVGAAAWLLWRDGLLGEAWYWTFSDHDVPHIFWLRGVEHSALFLAFALPLVLPILAWRRLRAAWRGYEAELGLVLAWLAVSLIGAAAGGRFYPHYYIQLVPSLALLAGVFYARRSWRFPVIWLSGAALVSLAVASAQLWVQRAPSPAAAYVRAHSGPQDRLFVWGQATPMYMDADRLPASRYIATFPLTGYIFGGLPGVDTRARILPGAWDTLAGDLRRHPAQFIIDTQSRAGDAYPMRNFPQLAGLIARDYQPVAWLADGTVYRRRPIPSN